MERNENEDRFASVAGCYDRWVGWEPRLQKELPFLLSSLPGGCSVLDVGCGTGAHARALAAAGYRVTGLDFSAAMLAQARAASPEGPAVEWIEGDITDASLLGDRRFDAVLALGNVVPAFGEADAVRRGVEAMVAHVSPGGRLLLQYLNGERIRSQGRLVVKATEPGAPPRPAGGTDPPSPADGAGGPSLWLRHHFEAGGRLLFNSYQLRHEGGTWKAEGKVHEYHDYPRTEITTRLRADFAAVEVFDGLSGAPFEPAASDSLGIRASGRR